MKRKHFIASAVASLASFTTRALPAGSSTEPAIRQPAFLKPGDWIGVCSPAGYITEAELQPAIRQLTEWGFRVKIGSSIGQRDHTFGGTDAERAADLQAMLDDTTLAAILCARGGYGVVRILDQLQFNQFKQQPKWVIGFSDISALHCHLLHHCRAASLHAKMANSFPESMADAEPKQRESIVAIKNCLMGQQMLYKCEAHSRQVNGRAEAELVGGNLKVIESLIGSSSELDTKNKILFLEDTGEYLYSVDRMFWTLLRSGKLQKLAGLIIGGFKVKADDDGEPFGLSLEDIVLEKLKDSNFPVVFNFPVGHQKHNMPLRIGARHRLTVTTTGVELVSL